MTKERRYDIDGLRVVATVAVFLFHCTRLFDTEGWHLKNPQQSEMLFIAARALVYPWVMELFFLLSGAATWYALRSKPAGAYLWGRVKRLLVPLYTVGLLILLPPQYYFEMLTNAGYQGSFWQVLPRYFASFPLPGLTAWPETLLPMPFSGHLWFLQYLLLITPVTLPLLLYLKSERGQHRVKMLAAFCQRRGAIFVFGLPLALLLTALRGLFAAQRSWADFAWYTAYFVIGFIIASDTRFTEAVRRHGWLGLVAWLVGFGGGVGALVLSLGYDPIPGHESFSLLYVFYQVTWTITSWGAVIFFLSLGAKYLDSPSRLSSAANEAVLPFYLLHQTVILAVGFYLVDWQLGIIAKLLIVIGVSFPLLVGLCQLLIHRTGVLRMLFGLRWKRQGSPALRPSPLHAR